MTASCVAVNAPRGEERSPLQSIELPGKPHQVVHDRISNADGLDNDEQIDTGEIDGAGGLWELHDGPTCVTSSASE